MATDSTTKTGLIKRMAQAVQRGWVAAVDPAYMEKKAKAFFSQRTGYYQPMYVFNGEKNNGELGPTKNYLLDYASLRSRGNQFYLDNEVVQIVINRMNAWVIGNGLRLESEPDELILQSEGIKVDLQKFSDLVEARCNTLKESRETTYSRERNLSMEESRAFISSSNGGAILVVLRVKNGIVNAELIDGGHIRHPQMGTDLNPTLLENGNRICNGIEMNNAGEHIRYWVLDAEYKYSSIEARSKSTGLRMAFLYGGADYLLDNSMAIPVLAGLFQTLSQMDEYKTATLGSAKEQNENVYQGVSDVNSTNENPFGAILAKANTFGPPDGSVPIDSQWTEIANTVKVGLHKDVVMNPAGMKLEPIAKNEAELYFKDFWGTLFEVVCAAAGMPPNVALQRFDTSFSSARAAIKDWEHSLLLKRYKHGRTFLQYWYELQLHIDILTGKVQAPGYLTAFRENNIIVLETYRNTRWVGDNVPHIDPVKEVQAEREKLGTAMAHVPLTTQKKATEALNGGASKLNTIDAGRELKDAEANGIKPDAAVQAEFAPKITAPVKSTPVN